MLNNYLLFFLLFVFFLSSILAQQIITLKKNNFITIDDTINDSNVVKWSGQLSKLTSNTIFIYIDSTGGSVDSGLQFINNMEWYIKRGKTINCIVKSAYSMAFVILQYCSNRYVMSSSTLMQHQMSLNNIKGPMNNLMNYLEMIEMMSKEIDENVSKRLGINLDDYRNKIKNDWWLTGSSAISNGVVDSMVIVGCDVELYDTYTKQEDFVFNIDLDGNLELKKNDIIKNMCPL